MRIIKAKGRSKKDRSMAIYGRIDEMDRLFDYEYWRQFSSTERSQAAWELARDYHCRVEGVAEDALRLDRTVGSLQRLPS